MTNVKKKRKIHKFKRSSKPKPLTDDSGGDNVLGTYKFRSLLRDSVLRRCTKFHKDEAKQCLATATTVVNSLIQKMMVDPLFQRLYQYTYNSGSYFKGTKVTAPREFDFNLVFKIPMPSSVWKNEDIKGHDYLTGYSMFRFEGKPTHLEEIESEFKSYSGDDNRKQREASPSKSSTSKIYQFEKYLLDTDGDCQYLSCAKILTWMQSLVDKVINKIKEELDAEDLTISVSNKRRSPALTLIIGKKQMEDGGTKKKRNKPTNIDIDLVPVIKYQSLFGKHATYELPDHINRKLFTKENKDEEPSMIQAIQSVFLVPKRPPEEILCKLPDEHRKMVEKFAWRFSFPGLEKAILYKKGCVKTLIRLFKVLRDKQNWDKISSYFIETIFYWKINQFPSSDKWEEWHLGKLFIKMLKVISEAMEKQELPHFFFPKMNLLAAVNKETISTISNCLKNINSQIKKTENSIYSIYKIEKQKPKKRTPSLSSKLHYSFIEKLIKELLSVADLKFPKDLNNFTNSSDDGCLAVSVNEEDVCDYDSLAAAAFEEDVCDYDSLAAAAFEEDVCDYDSLAAAALEDYVYDIL